MNKPDEVSFEILGDGSLKIETNVVSVPNHLNCERLLAECAKLAGGVPEVKHKQSKARQGHSHGHGQGEHVHQ